MPSLHDPLPERRWRWAWSGDDLSLWQTPPGDVDGDRRADLFIWMYTEEDVPYVGVVRGFEVPWEDPVYWP